jgi:hypothetical protein
MKNIWGCWSSALFTVRSVEIHKTSQNFRGKISVEKSVFETSVFENNSSYQSELPHTI